MLRVQVRGKLTGASGEQQELVVIVTSDQLPPTVFQRDGDALLEMLSAFPDLRLRRYRFCQTEG